jgi:iron-sulfur cluster repair protein YtfE (RIC family)
MLDKDMDLSQEVSEYLQYILALPQDTIDKALKELQNYANKIEQV